MFNYDDLYKCVFDKEIDANKLIIITGYIGPAIIEEKSTTIPINSKDAVTKDSYGNLIIHIGGDNYEL